MPHYFCTSESVSIGHPDKIADQIADGVLDAYLEADPDACVACEAMVTRNLVVLGGEITAKAQLDLEEPVRRIIQEAGYGVPDLGFDCLSCALISLIHPQATDIALEAASKRLVAGDQGVVFGYASDETPELMPLPILLAHRIMRELRLLRSQNRLSYLRPDAKTQVTIEYDPEGRPVRIHSVLLSTQHTDLISLPNLRGDLLDWMHTILPKDLIDPQTLFYLNPAGKFAAGGPAADTGLTGRKLMVDTYGSSCAHGGGSFSGKDPSKIDRSGAYMARYIAKNVVSSGLASRCTVQLAYGPGIPYPIAINLFSQGGENLPNEILLKAVKQVFPLELEGIVSMLKLRKPIYRRTAYEGHFGKNTAAFSWEQTDQANALLRSL